jgi:hypothetical protein
MRKTFWLLTLLVVAFMSFAHADDAQTCDDETIQAIAAWAGVEGKLLISNRVSPDGEPDGLIAAAACKVMPNAPGTTIAAIAFGHYLDEHIYDGRQMKIIALVEAGKVVAANRSTIERDFSLNMVNLYRIDTAPYILSKEVRAFGVASTAADAPLGWGCSTGGFAGFTLTLWIREGENLRALFGIHRDLWRYGPCVGEDWEEGAYNITLAVEKTSSHGFADLAVTAHVKQTNLIDNSEISRRTVRKVVKYDGQSYRGIDDPYGFWWD